MTDGAPQPQLPFMQSCGGGHMCPQLPQLSGSICVTTQTPLHAVPIPLHEHCDAAHVSGVAHTCPHDPQLFGSLVSSMQAPPHVMPGQRLVQTPLSQVATPFGGTTHFAHDAPQWSGPLGTHTPPQKTSLVAHCGGPPSNVGTDASVPASVALGTFTQ